eukprot:m51a1_g1384 hypothetical protein (289) ;mRNA; f:454859-455819
MEALHSRVVPCTAHTLDDLVFAAFQGPVLSLDARVLHRYRTFTALLLLRTRWRTDRHLSPADVAAALVHARCRRPSTLEEVQCHTCGGVLDVSENIPEGIELYSATVRTRCTSSRKHVGCTMLVLAAELAPGLMVVSGRFAIYARNAGRHAAVAHRSVASQEETPSGSPVVESALLKAPSPLSVELPMGGLFISVYITAVSITQEEQQQVSCGLVPVLRSNVPGFLMQKASMHPSVVVIVGAFCWPGALPLAGHFGKLFIQNDIRNPLNRNLVAEGLVQPLLAITNIG